MRECTWLRPVGIVVLGIQIAGCASWKTSYMGVVGTLNARPATVRVETREGRRVEVADPQVVADSIRGRVRECVRVGPVGDREVCAMFTATVAAVSDVTRVEVSRFSVQKTAIVFLALPVFALVVFFASGGRY